VGLLFWLDVTALQAFAWTGLALGLYVVMHAWRTVREET
jgi:hypothetical protein